MFFYHIAIFSHSNETEVVPHLFQQVVKVPLVVGGDGHAVRYLVDNVQFLINKNRHENERVGVSERERAKGNVCRGDNNKSV